MIVSQALLSVRCLARVDKCLSCTFVAKVVNWAAGSLHRVQQTDFVVEDTAAALDLGIAGFDGFRIAAMTGCVETNFGVQLFAFESPH